MEVDKQRIAELVNQIQGGNNSAFDELYKLTSQRAYFVALEFTKNNQDAEDILQDSYIKALSKINELDKPESFSSWLNQIVANKSKDFLKKKKPMLFEAEDNEVFEVIPDEDTSFSPEENLDQTELQKTVMEVLDELSEEKRACVLMMYFEELSVGEIAETLEIPEGTVKTRLFSARKDLKEKFAKRGITSLYSTAPIGVVIWALRRMSDAVSKTFAASPASAKVFAGIAVAGTGTAAGVAAAGTTAAGTGVAAKIAALTVTQKIIAGVSVAAVVAGGAAGVVTVTDNNNNKYETSTTAYTEEYTTAPSFETTVAVEALGTVEFSETRIFSENNSTSVDGSTSKNSITKPQSTTGKTTAKSTTSAKQTTTKKQTTTQKSTTTTQKQTTTTTNPTTTKKETTVKATTTEKQTTTTKPAVTTTKPTTTEATTQGKATIRISIIDLDGTTVVATVTDTVNEGETISKDYLWDLVEANGYEVSDVYDGDIGAVAEADKTYSFKADLFEV